MSPEMTFLFRRMSFLVYVGPGTVHQTIAIGFFVEASFRVRFDGVAQVREGPHETNNGALLLMRQI